jgi:hypothetical protein
MRNSEEIKEAVETLKINKEKSEQFNFFGEDNHIRIDIMIDVIQEKRNEDFVYKHYQSSFPDGSEDTVGHGNWRSAMTAIEYLKGEIELKDLLYPEVL